MDIRLKDESTEKVLDYHDTAFAYGGAINVGYTLASDLSLNLSTGWRHAHWQFDPIGDLDGNRVWVGLGVNYRIGWRARTLW